MKFSVLTTDQQTNARLGRFETDHGSFETPTFMPVGTLGSVKGIHQRELENDIQAQILLGNTYHLFLKPGTTIVEEAGGLHQFMGWKRPILTDSGGYQVYSLS
ncbi:MAG: tRNA guanosine(34) transglycosylase Tgt, partial [Bacteroidetes bacterium SW_10_40_5]